jgi:hypothetical protein
MPRDPVLTHAANAQSAARRYGVPASVILGLLSVEGGTDAHGRPVAPGDGAGPPSYGQFTYGTGRALGIHYGDSKSEVDGVARYLLQLGYKSDPTRALARYNGGSNPPPVSWTYAGKVNTAAKRYGAFDHGATAPASPSSSAPSSSSSAPSSGSSSASTGSSDRPLTPAQHSTMVKFGITAALVLAGVALVAGGVLRTSGVRAGNVAAAAGKAAGMAAKRGA